MENKLTTWHEAMSAGGIDGYDNYIGDTDIRDMYIVISKTRDSDCLTRANFDAMLSELGGESDTVQVHRFGHWACGWVESILIDPGDSQAIETANKIKAALEDYPVIDDQLYYEYEDTYIRDTWDSFDMRTKIDLCVRYGESKFAARRDSIIYDNDKLYAYLSCE